MRQLPFQIFNDIRAIGYPHIIIVRRIINRVVVVRHQQVSFNRLLKRNLIDHIIVTKREDVLVVHSKRRGRQAEQETGLEMIHYLAVAVSCSMVEFVHYDVVKVVLGKHIQMLVTAEGLDSGKVNTCASSFALLCRGQSGTQAAQRGIPRGPDRGFAVGAQERALA